MGKEEKKAVRSAFRKAVFERDRYCCRVCGAHGKDRQGGDDHKRFHSGHGWKFTGELEELDAHHIVDRHLMPNGGYVAENGISLCGECHERAEIYWIDENKRNPMYMPEHLYDLIGSSLDVAYEASEQLAVNCSE
jgi:5-methylcytosine-specific restriction endonuclease McrA